MKVRYMSDLHIEGSNCRIDTSDCDVLILAGDICAYLEDFYIPLQHIPSNLPVILVAGNHEYETQNVTTYIQTLKDRIKSDGFQNVHVLENESIIIDGVTFIGATLWSNGKGFYEACGKGDDSFAILGNLQDIESKVLKYSKTTHPDSDRIHKHITWQHMVELFDKSYAYIKNTLNEANGPCVVVTHFAPCFRSSFKNQPVASYWCNELPELMGIAKFWIHGHVHNSRNYKVSGTNILCNPRGYSKLFNHAENVEFNPKATFEVNA